MNIERMKQFAWRFHAYFDGANSIGRLDEAWAEFPETKQFDSEETAYLKSLVRHETECPIEYSLDGRTSSNAFWDEYTA